jgi:Domain of unknown function (DUF5664)
MAEVTSVVDLKDSGERQQFKSGAVRDTAAGKPLLELLPGWALLAYAWIMEAGARKYAARNWEQGMPMSRYLASAHRHLELYRMGFRDEAHLWQAFWNIGGAIHTSILVHLGVYPQEFFDLPNHISEQEIGPLGEFERVRVESMLGSSAIKGQRPGEKSYPKGV